MRAPRLASPSPLPLLAVAVAAAAAATAAACGDNGTPPQPPDPGVTTERCSYVPVAPTARAGGTVAAGPLMAGAAERVLHVPVGTALGGYTGRASLLGSGDNVDGRSIALSGSFNPSIGVTTAPRVKALALSAGGETVVLVKADMIFAYEGLLFDLEQRLGPDFAGKVLLAASHSHSAWAQFTAHAPLQLGAGPRRALVYRRFLDDLEAAARDALARLAPARLGIYETAQFDPQDLVGRDRRPENDGLPGGNRGEDHLYLLRVDAAAGAPIAIVPIFGQHSTLNGQDNALASADATGALERALEEQFDERVVVMHLQGAGADTSAVGHGGVDCSSKPGKATDPCFAWTAEEGHGIEARKLLLDAWSRAGAAMRDQLELEMVTRSIETGLEPGDVRDPRRRAALRGVGRQDARRRPDPRGRAAELADRRAQRAGRRRAVRGGLADGPRRRDRRHRGHGALRLVPPARSRRAGPRPAVRARPRRRGAPPRVRDDAHHDLGAADRRPRDRHAAGRGRHHARGPGPPAVAARRADDRRRLRAGPRRLHAAARGLGARRLRAERDVLGPARGRVDRRAAARADPAGADARARGRRGRRSGRGERRASRCRRSPRRTTASRSIAPRRRRARCRPPCRP